MGCSGACGVDVTSIGRPLPRPISGKTSLQLGDNCCSNSFEDRPNRHARHRPGAAHEVGVSALTLELRVYLHGHRLRASQEAAREASEETAQATADARADVAG